MGENDGSGGSSFDGKITGWPTDNSLNICNAPVNQNEFIRYVATELYKNQIVSQPLQQAKEAIHNAKILYNQLKQEGYFESE